VSRYEKKHSPTHTHRGHQSSQSAFSIYYEPWHPPYSIHVLCSLFPQSLSKFSLVYFLAWYPPLHTPYVSSPNHCLLFAAHAHRNGSRLKLEIGEIFHIFPSGNDSMGARRSKKAYTRARTGMYLRTKFGWDRSIVAGCRPLDDRQTNKHPEQQ